MRRSIAVAIVLVMMVGSLGCFRRGGKLVGSWERIYPAERAALVTEGTAGETGAVKILTDTHFAFGRMGTDGRLYAGGGRYTLKGDIYTETIAYHFIPKLIGKTITFTCNVEGDRWYHSGIFEVDGEQFHIEEVWRRIR